MEKEISDYLERLKQERNNFRNQLHFLLSHKFEKEAQFYRDKMTIVDEIISTLELVVQGHKKGIEVKFYF